MTFTWIDLSLIGFFVDKLEDFLYDSTGSRLSLCCVPWNVPAAEVLPLIMFIQQRFVFSATMFLSRARRTKRTQKCHGSQPSSILCFWIREGEEKTPSTNAYKKDPDHASVDCSTERNTRRPLRIQVLTQCGNIKGNSEAWNKRTQLAIQSTQLYCAEWDIFCWDVTQYIFHQVQTVKSAEYKKALVTDPEILLWNCCWEALQPRILGWQRCELSIYSEIWSGIQKTLFKSSTGDQCIWEYEGGAEEGRLWRKHEVRYEKTRNSVRFLWRVGN